MKFLEFYRLNEAKPVGDKNKELWLDYLKKNYSDKDVSDLFVSFVSVDKIGINPKSTFKTPNGVYTYPMKFLLDGNVVPFRGMNKPKKIKILKAISDKVLDHSLSNKNYKIAVDELVKNYRDRFDVNNIEKYLEDFEDMNSEENNYKKLWKLTFQIKSNSNDWSKMLIDLGFDWSNDKGEGIIHKSEPTQAVFLNPKSYKVVDEEFVDTEERYKDRNVSSLDYDEIKDLLKNDELLYDNLILNMHKIRFLFNSEFKKDKKSNLLSFVLLKLNNIKSPVLINDIIFQFSDVIELCLPLDSSILNQIPNIYFETFIKKFHSIINGLVYNDLKHDYISRCFASILTTKLDEHDFYIRYRLVIKKLLRETQIKWLKYSYINENLQKIILDDNKQYFVNLMGSNPKLFIKSVDEDNAKYFFKTNKQKLTKEEQEYFLDYFRS